MKKTKPIALLLVVILIIALSACGKVKEKIAEKGLEKAMEKATGSKVDITKDGGKIEINGQSIAVGDDLAWPQDVMGDLPVPKAKISTVVKSQDGKGSMVTLTGFENVKEYKEKLKELGYEDIMNAEDEDSLYYSGRKAAGDKNAIAGITYNFQEKEGLITYHLE